MVIQESTPGGGGGAGISTDGSRATSPDVEWPPSGGFVRRVWLLGARRRYLVNKRRQLRTAAILLAVVFVFLVLINVTLYLGRKQETAILIAEAPQLEQVLGRYDRTEVVLSLLGSVVILAGVYFVTIIETHRTAGAEFNLIRQLGQVADGKYGSQLKLRKGDNLRDVEEPFNRMVRALAQRAEDDAATLERLATELEGSGVRGAAAAVVAELRKLAIARRSLLD